MKNLFLLSSLFLFVACSSSSLHYQKHSITLQNKNYSLSFDGNTLYNSQQNLSKISIKQHVFQDDMHELIVYERARLATGYKFKYNYQYILRHVFDARNVELMKNENGLGFFSITLKDKSRLNAVVITRTKKSLTMLYGFSDENFKALMSGSVLQKLKPKKEELKNKIKSQWSMKLIITGTLLEKEGAKPIRYK